MTAPEPTATQDSVFTAAERAYLHTQRLARLATVDQHGRPQNSPVGLHYNPQTDTIDVIGWNLAASRKYRNVLRRPHVALVVDDMPVEGAPRGIEIRGHAQALHVADATGTSGHAIIRIHAERIVSWGLTAPEYAGNTKRAFPTGRSARTQQT
jgi:pyridoxamine 5'-phosphate oxidase family protein